MFEMIKKDSLCSCREILNNYDSACFTFFFFLLLHPIFIEQTKFSYSYQLFYA